MQRKRNSFCSTANADWMMIRKQRISILTHNAVFHLRSDVIRDLGVLLDRGLKMTQRISHSLPEPSFYTFAEFNK